MIIGLCGAAGCGKSTVAAHLRERHDFFDFALADPLYGMVAAMTGMMKDELQDRRRKESPIEWLGKSPRQLLQLLGTEFGRGILGEDVWIRHLFRRIDATQAAMDRYWGRPAQCSFAVCDVRFDNEAAAIRGRGGVIWRVVRPNQEKVAADHSSEGGISLEHCAMTIVNDGGLDTLRGAVDEALKSLQGGTMRVA